MDQPLGVATTAIVEAKRLGAAKTVQGIANALHSAAASWAPDSAPLSQLADDAAEHLDALATRLRDRRVAELIADAEALAQHRPGLFIAGAMALGFVLGRIVLAAGTIRREHETRDAA